MGIDMLIPFGILIVITIYLIYSRTKFEKDIVNIYEEKFEEWKKHNLSKDNEIEKKELVGLIFKEKYKLSCELFEEEIEDRLRSAKFEIKYIKREN
ncbi:hypothetical protein [Arcobacter porcinus]|uniref:hypothetical protein n=1 Tax=Arcobacter porcinus TaxID=1935204 RepID=UPI000826C45E|nr:hypothetical protein [Arcobacter porcinus]